MWYHCAYPSPPLVDTFARGTSAQEASISSCACERRREVSAAVESWPALNRAGVGNVAADTMSHVSPTLGAGRGVTLIEPLNDTRVAKHVPAGQHSKALVIRVDWASDGKFKATDRALY